MANASEDTQDRPTTTSHCCSGQCTSSARGGWTYSGVHLWALWCCPDAGGPKQTPTPNSPFPLACVRQSTSNWMRRASHLQSFCTPEQTLLVVRASSKQTQPLQLRHCPWGSCSYVRSRTKTKWVLRPTLRQAVLCSRANSLLKGDRHGLLRGMHGQCARVCAARGRDSRPDCPKSDYRACSLLDAHRGGSTQWRSACDQISSTNVITLLRA
jgi:hypothetical protein